MELCRNENKYRGQKICENYRQNVAENPHIKAGKENDIEYALLESTFVETSACRLPLESY